MDFQPQFTERDVAAMKAVMSRQSKPDRQRLAQVEYVAHYNGCFECEPHNPCEKGVELFSEHWAAAEALRKK